MYALSRTTFFGYLFQSDNEKKALRCFVIHPSDGVATVGGFHVFSNLVPELFPRGAPQTTRRKGSGTGQSKMVAHNCSVLNNN